VGEEIKAGFAPSVKIIDFGQACLAANRPSRIHTALSSKAPELAFNRRSDGVVAQDWGTPVDIWALGCLVYFLVCSRNLLRDVASDDGLINTVITLFGDVPERWKAFLPKKQSYKSDAAASDPFYQLYLNNLCDFDTRLDSWDILTDYAEYTGDDRVCLKDLLRRAFTVDPRSRITAAELLMHPWFNP